VCKLRTTTSLSFEWVLPHPSPPTSISSSSNISQLSLSSLLLPLISDPSSPRIAFPSHESSLTHHFVTQSLLSLSSNPKQTHEEISLLPLDLPRLAAAIDKFKAPAIPSDHSPRPPDGLQIDRSVIDSRFLSVEIVTRILNPDPQTAFFLQLTEPLPTNFLSPLFHEFTLSQSQLITPSPPSVSPVSYRVLDQVPYSFIPPLHSSFSSQDPSQHPQPLFSLLLNLTIPPNSLTILHLPCEKKFLTRSSQPTDASRGVDIPQAIVNYFPLSSSDASLSPQRRVLFTEAWVITMPFPDGSMPFNVIIIVCTTVALLYGSLANVLIRKSSLDSLKTSQDTKKSL
jgi:hypothetical protein